MKNLNSNNNFITEIWNFVHWNDFSLKFCALKWFQSEIQSEISCFKMISVWNFMLWNEFSLKFCALKWIQTENLCNDMTSVWNFVLWNEFSLKIWALKWFHSEFCALNKFSLNYLLWHEFNLKFWALKFFALNWNFLSRPAIVQNFCECFTEKLKFEVIFKLRT